MAAGTVSGVTPTSPAEGQGLAGSAADRLALGVAASGTAWSASSAGTVSTSADDELAELVQGRPVAAPPTASGAGGYPPPTRTGARPPVSSTRPAGEAITGPTWERIQRFEAYPTIKTKTGMRGAPRIAVLAGAVGIAAIALFMLPALLGIGGGPSSSVKPGGSGGASTASPAPTAVPAPTPLVYIVKKGDNLGKIAKKHGVTIDELLAVNPEITNPNEISLGQVIVIPLSASDPPPKPTPKASASASS
jgi:LysM repeat protein